MYSVWVELQVLPGRLDEFLDAIKSNAAHSVSDEPGCLFFDVIELDRESQRFAFYEIYRDREAFVTEHRSAPHYAKWREAVAATVVPGSHSNTEGIRLVGAATSVPAPAAPARTV